MLKTCLHAVLVFAFALTWALPLAAQDKEHVPSGNLSDFFNPPGVPEKAETSSTTRSIGDGALKSDSAMKAEELKAAIDSTEAPPAKLAEGDATVDDLASMDKSADGSATKGDAGDAEGAGESSGRVDQQNLKSSANRDEGNVAEIELGTVTKTNWRVGIGLLAGDKPVQNMVCRIPVPVQWPEQSVTVFEEDLPAAVTDVGWEDLENIRIMKFRIENVAPNERMIATVTFTVSTSQILPPKNTSVYRIPQRRTKEIKPYFGESPEISIRNTKLKKRAKLLFESSRSDWGKIEDISNWIVENIEERAGESKGSLDAFLNNAGSGEDRVSLFVAMCRINRVPARMVFVHGTQYAEFYLVDENGKGRWFPCKISGIPEFGAISEPKVILQKGDNYRVPGEKQKLKFVPEKASWKGNRPRKMGFLREPLAVKQ